MNAHEVISLIGAVLSVGLAFFTLLWRSRSFASLTLAAGMVVLAAEGLLSLLAMQTTLPSELLNWEYRGVLVTALLPGPWLFFSLSFARENYREFLAKWKWPALAVSLLPFLIVVFFGDSLFARFIHFEASSDWVLRLGWSGYTLYVLLILNMTLILINLERTLRASYGRARWRIKFTLLGVGSLFVIRIYTAAQAVLFSSASAAFSTVNAAALIIADLLIIVSSFRHGLRSSNIYVSQQVLHGSFTLLVVGAYLLLVGIVAKLAQYFEIGRLLLDNALLLFLAFLGAAALLLSEDLRLRAKRFVHRHFERPTYDYRKIWTTLTTRTASLVDIRDICQEIVKTVSETFGVAAVSIWLADDVRGRPYLAGSTALSSSQRQRLDETGKQVSACMAAVCNLKMPLDLHGKLSDGAAVPDYPDSPSEDYDPIRYCAALNVSGEFLGVMTLSDRLDKEHFTFEDMDLLKTICEQAAGILLNQRLFESLSRAKEMEALQTFSTFFLHDLKNVSSTLSLTLENLPVHYENPEFREDAMRVLAKSVERIRGMSSRMSLLRKNLELQRTECDVNDLVAASLAGLDGARDQPLISDLGPVPKLWVDGEQIHKVLVNLVLNAREAATAERGEILVSTGVAENFVVIAVRDQGCGMTEEFIRGELFRPFKTTKENGLGIGLYHSKVIVEAHRGRIEVESKPGEGSTFRVLLPIGRGQASDAEA